MSKKRSRWHKLLDWSLHLFSGNPGLAFFGLKDLQPDDADEQAQRRREREREQRGEDQPKQ